MRGTSITVACALAATITACQDLAEFGDGSSLRQVATFGRPGPTPTDQRPGGVLRQLWFRPHERGLVGCRANGAVALVDRRGRVLESPMKTNEVCDYAEGADLLLLRQSDDEIILVDLDRDDRTTVTHGAYSFGAVSNDGSVVALSRDQTIELWDIASKSLTRKIATKLDVRNGLAVSADASTVAAAEGTYRGRHRTTLEVWNATSGQKIAELDQPGADDNAGVWGLLLSGDGRRLAAGTQLSARAGLRVWNEAKDILFERGGFRSYWVRALDLTDDGQLLASGDEHGNVVVWDLAAGSELANARPGQVVQSVAISPDKKQVATGLWDSRIILWTID